MEQLNLVNFIFLVVLFVLMPRAALRSARQLRQAQAEGKPLPRTRIVVSTAFSLTIMWFLSQMNATLMRRSLFDVGTLGARELGIGVLGLAVLLLAIPVSRKLRSPDEDRRRLEFSIAPRTTREYLTFMLIAVMAGIAEESAYRGVATWILQPILGGLVPAIFLSAMAFGVAHAVQGGKTMAVVIAMALVFHAIVYLTGTLVIAMVVHAVYDGVAGYVAGRRALQLAAEDAAPASTSA
jgi:membrane protease YdiL (CAAX protease family)